MWWDSAPRTASVKPTLIASSGTLNGDHVLVWPDEAGQRGGPQACEGTAAGVEGEMVGAVEPARRHHPAVPVPEVALPRPGNGVLVPRMVDVDRVAERIVGDEL